MSAQKCPQLPEMLLGSDICVSAKETGNKPKDITEHKILERELQLFYFTGEDTEDQRGGMTTPNPQSQAQALSCVLPKLLCLSTPHCMSILISQGRMGRTDGVKFQT